MATVNVTVKLEIDDTVKDVNEVIANMDYNFWYHEDDNQLANLILETEITNVVIWEE